MEPHLKKKKKKNFYIGCKSAQYRSQSSSSQLFPKEFDIWLLQVKHTLNIIYEFMNLILYSNLAQKSLKIIIT